MRSINARLALTADEYLPAILDIFISIAFVTLASYAMIHTTVKQQIVSYVFILILETFNKGVIILLSSLDPTGIVRIIESGVSGEETS